MRQPTLPLLPSDGPFLFERALRVDGAQHVAGLDEAGRGCLAGPVVAAAVILPDPIPIDGINDSKKLSPRKREELFTQICVHAVAWSTGLVDSVEIDRINILEAALKAMRLAVDDLPVQPDHLLIDGPHGIDAPIAQTALIQGDSRSVSIAAASIIAKVTRDRMMVAFERDYPAFRFSAHKGYGTAAHLAEIRTHGPTPIHRMTFRGVR